MNNHRNTSPHKGSPRNETSKTIRAETLAKINLDNPDASLFDITAEECARQISECGGETNKSTQLRRFYDEVCAWHAKVQQKPQDFEKLLPLIRMINAKVAYAQGRKLVDSKFAGLIQECLRNVKSEKAFYNFKIFFEAFLGFYKFTSQNNRESPT